MKECPICHADAAKLTTVEAFWFGLSVGEEIGEADAAICQTHRAERDATRESTMRKIGFINES